MLPAKQGPVGKGSRGRQSSAKCCLPSTSRALAEAILERAPNLPISGNRRPTRLVSIVGVETCKILPKAVRPTGYLAPAAPLAGGLPIEHLPRPSAMLWWTSLGLAMIIQNRPIHPHALCTHVRTTL